MPQQKLECNDIRMITSLAERNLGIGVLSYIDALPYLERDELVFKPIIEKGMHPLTLALCVAPKRQISRISQIMMNHLIDQMEDLKSNYNSSMPHVLPDSCAVQIKLIGNKI